MKPLVLAKKGNDNISTSGANSRISALVSKAQQITSICSSSAVLEIAFIFDTTGSMYDVFATAQQAISRISDEISGGGRKVKMSFIAYKNHGDERCFDGKRPFVSSGWTTNPTEIRLAMSRVPNGGGGDGLTALEDVLHYLANEQWDTDAKRAIVLIGDMPPHGVVDSVNRCPYRLNYRESVSTFKRENIAVYSVYCDTSGIFSMKKERKEKIVDFYRQIAEETGGRLLSLEDTATLVMILTAICKKETGQLDEYEKALASRQQLTAKAGEVIRSLKA